MNEKNSEKIKNIGMSFTKFTKEIKISYKQNKSKFLSKIKVFIIRKLKKKEKTRLNIQKENIKFKTHQTF